LLQAKRNKAKEVAAANTYPHTLSRGGYKLLEERMLNDKQRLREEATAADPSLSFDGPPSPPKRHEKWKQARIKKSGEYTSSSSQSVAEKIVSGRTLLLDDIENLKILDVVNKVLTTAIRYLQDSLVEQSTQGSFVAEGRADILSSAIGKPEHPGRVRGVGQGVGIISYFGKSSHRRHFESSMSQQAYESLRQSIREDVTASIREEVTASIRDEVTAKITQEVAEQVQYYCLWNIVVYAKFWFIVLLIMSICIYNCCTRRCAWISCSNWAYKVTLGDLLQW
jgi:hypothetical protein